MFCPTDFNPSSLDRDPLSKTFLSIMPSFCSVLHCEFSSEVKRGFFRFPKCPVLNELWKVACGGLRDDAKDPRICGHHFLETDVSFGRLSSAALPSIGVHSDSSALR